MRWQNQFYVPELIAVILVTTTFTILEEPPQLFQIPALALIHRSRIATHPLQLEGKLRVCDAQHFHTEIDTISSLH